MDRALTFIMAGGKGERLHPLTEHIAKPSVEFGGKYLIIDFVVSNLINSGFYKIKVLTQYKADYLIRHLTNLNLLNPNIGQYIDIVPPQMRIGDIWYRGTADAIYQNLDLITEISPDYVLVFGGDHIYKMDINHFYTFHIRKKADMTISTIPVHKSEAHRFGIIEVDKHNRIIGFVEKPKKNPPVIPGKRDYCLVSMGNYILSTDFLFYILEKETRGSNYTHDFGKDVIPNNYKDYNIAAYDFSKNRVPGVTGREKGYWRDIGDIDAYYEANMDLCSVSPSFNLYSREWPIRTVRWYYPPAKFVFDDDGRRGSAFDSIVGEGTILSGAIVKKSVISQNVRIHSGSKVESSIILDGVGVGENTRIKNAIIDRRVNIPNGTRIGYNLKNDKKLYSVSKKGIVVIPRDYKFGE